ncbi:hypothetical protein CLAFUW4_06633 [Fulvia fulva]|nr:hypothetical protein CLAFUR4_06641 [Fulvia fulva]WPV16509.1 hypothetical protein CLAFUW4_06633 [Fulvia fulva]WPV31690.1 hypothetical protein CLAFUW7_06632 [Fulvia fulva]
MAQHFSATTKMNASNAVKDSNIPNNSINHHTNHQMASSAATRVFSIPELLENILIYMGNNLTAQLGELRWGKNKPPPPQFDLFVMKRVNNTFEAVIEKSKTCRQLMLLQPLDDTRDSQRRLAGWLFAQLGFCTDYGLNNAPWCDADVQLVDGSYLEVTGQLRDTVAYFAKLEAYRSLKWVRRHWPKATREAQKPYSHMKLGVDVWVEQELTESLDDDLQPSWRWERSLEDYERYREEISQEPGDFGTLLDHVLAVLSRSPSQHRAARGTKMSYEVLGPWHPDYQDLDDVQVKYTRVAKGARVWRV